MNTMFNKLMILMLAGLFAPLGVHADDLIPFVFYDAEATILYFAADTTVPEANQQWNGKSVDYIWSGDDVLNMTDANPDLWSSTSNVRSKATKVVFDQSFASIRPASCCWWFYCFTKLKEIEGLEYLNTSEVTTMANMFYYCTSLTKLDLNNFDMSNVTSAMSMFYSCTNLTTIYCNNTWNLDKANTMRMFVSCTHLEGAVAYNGGKVEGDMANPDTGYFTYQWSQPATDDGFGEITWYDFRDVNFKPGTDGKGTFYDPIVIDTPRKLAQLSYLVNVEHNDYKGKVFTLGSDINLEKYVNGERVCWVPIGYSFIRLVSYEEHPFNGMFLGMEHDANTSEWQPACDHTISGMYINAEVPYTDNDYFMVANVGLFGQVNGYLGHIRMTDATVNISVSNLSKLSSDLLSLSVGILCGSNGDGYNQYDTNDAYLYQELISDDSANNYFRAPTGISDVSVQGTINLSKSSTSTYLGGIAGISYGRGVSHSTADVNFTYTKLTDVDNSNGDVIMGGICGDFSQSGSGAPDAGITDCVTHVNITGNGQNVSNVGGIVGLIQAGSTKWISGCTSSGKMQINIKNASTCGMGGIAGAVYKTAAKIQGCASTMWLEGNRHVGGILGGLNDSDKSNTGDPIVDGCIFAGHIQAPGCQHVGGIMGSLNYGSSATGLYVSESLMVGTLNMLGASYRGIIAGYCPNPTENVGGCYYDKAMAKDEVVGSINTHVSIMGLDTYDLTSGDISTVPMLPTDESADYGFTLKKGSYPQVFSNKEWAGYQMLDNEYNNNTKTNEAGTAIGLKKEHSFPYWRYDQVEKSNTLYQTGTWLASQPMTMPKGDQAYDLVTYLVSRTKENTWNTADGREVKVKATTAYTDITDSIKCITISADTAKVVANGVFLTELTMKPDKGIASVFNRPLPIGATKTLRMITAPDQEWDGTFASEFAAGTGKAEDPYIIKNGAQLAYAVQHNHEGEFFKQLCDITLVKDLIDYTSYYLNGYNYGTIALVKENRQWGPASNGSTYVWDKDSMEWKARYDGDGHIVRGAYMPDYQYQYEIGFFGNIAASGLVENFGLADCVAESQKSGLLAYKMDGTVRNCLLQGVVIPSHFFEDDDYMSYSGGICAFVGPTNASALIEDCVTAVYCNNTVKDYTPFVSLPESSSALQNKGKVQNCLAVVPTAFADADFDYHYTADGHSYIQDCYWLRGYEPTSTGYTLDEICAALSKRANWTYSKGYFPTLKSFAKQDIARLMTLPVRTDEGYDDGYDQYLLGFDRQLLFEPATAAWSFVTDFIDADADMGIVVPISYTTDYKTDKPSTRYVHGQDQLIAKLGKATYAIPVRTRGGQINPGITIEDPNARAACLAAFDTDGDGVLSLAEVKAVTATAMNDAFQNTQAATAKKTEKFPELRFFKNVTELTTQLNGFSSLTEVKLPYALTTIGSDAFDGCTSLTEVTLPAKVNWTDPHPFYDSSIENIYVDPFNEDFKSRDGILFDVNDVLIAYPNGRSGEEIVLEGTIIEIADGAIYNIDGLERIYFETEDYETVPYLNYDGIVTKDGELIDVYVSDATYGSVLMESYYDDGSWDEYIDAGKLHCYYPLNVTGALAATMYIGFDTQLPSELTPYIVTKTDKDEGVAYLRSMDRKVPSRTPVVILAKAAGKYRLMPLDEELEPWKMYENRLNGVGRDGMEVYQSDSDRGSILTLGYNSARNLGFYYYKGSRIAPYRAYLTYNWVEDANVKYVIRFVDDDEPTGIDEITTDSPSADSPTGWFTLDGRRLSGQPSQRGIYIFNGKKVMIK